MICKQTEQHTQHNHQQRLCGRGWRKHQKKREKDVMWWRCPLHKPFNGGEQRAHNKTGDRRANTLHTRTSSIASRIAGSDTSAMAVFNRKVTHFPISPGWSTYLKKTTCDFYRRDDTQSGPQHNLAPAITGKDTTCTSLVRWAANRTPFITPTVFSLPLDTPLHHDWSFYTA